MLDVASVGCYIPYVGSFSISLNIDLSAVSRIAAGVKDFETHCSRIDSNLNEFLQLCGTEED